MGKSEKMKPYVYISGLALRDNNRGTAALGYGAISFMQEKGILSENQKLINVYECGVKGFVKWIVKRLIGKDKIIINIEDKEWEYRVFSYLSIEKKLVKSKWFPFKDFLLSQGYAAKISVVTAINGGDGFSDIYGKRIFLQRLPGINFAMEHHLPLVLLPQTVGPFATKDCLNIATAILKYSSIVYVRDDCYVNELESIGAKYEKTNDLSYYMKPEPWDIEIDTKSAVGVNVSGLAWDNNFHTLAGQFENYPQLIKGIVKMFLKMGKTVYLISHSYNYNKPELNNDDLKAARELYNSLDEKSNLVLIDRDLISPQVKYVISRMSFFVGTRMHANFAAIFTKVPLFGLAYSYKFKGAFENNGIFNRTADINNITVEKIDDIIKKIGDAYKEDVSLRMN